MDEPPMTNPWVDEEGLRLFSQWLGMNYGKKVFGDHLDHHARRIFSHATSVIAARRTAAEPPALHSGTSVAVAVREGEYIAASDQHPMLAAMDAFHDENGEPLFGGADVLPAELEDVRDARRLVGMLVAEAGGRVVVRKLTMEAFNPAATVEFSEDERTGDRILELRAPEPKALLRTGRVIGSPGLGNYEEYSTHTADPTALHLVNCSKCSTEMRLSYTDESRKHVSLADAVVGQFEFSGFPGSRNASV